MDDGVPYARDREAGWYPDQQHRHERRYWDGRKWTDQVSDGGHVTTEVLEWDGDQLRPYERRQQNRDVDAYSDPERVARVFGPVTMSLAGLRTRKIVGEQYHQADLEAAAEGQRGPEGVWIEKPAELRPEPENPHDPNAVMILIDGRHVGYLPAKSVQASRPLVDRAIAEHGVATCPAVINKGWSDDPGVKGEYGVRLYYGTIGALE